MLTWTPSTKDYYAKLARLKKSPDYQKDADGVYSRIVSDPTVVSEYTLDDFNLHYMQDNGGPYAPDSEIMSRFKGPKPDSESAQGAYKWRAQMGAMGVDLAPNVKISKVYTDKNEIPITIYTPAMKDENMKLGAVVAFHGGGWLGGNVLVNEHFCKYLAQQANIRVFNVDYRLAPEYPAFAGIEDCYEAVTWIATNADKLHVDLKLFGVYGDSSGGNNAAAVSYVDRHEGTNYITHQLMCYPCVSLDNDTETALEHPVSDYHLDTFMQARYKQDELFTNTGKKVIHDVYVHGNDPKDPRISPYNMSDEEMKKMPKAFIATDEFDPLRGQGHAYAIKLAKNGVEAYLANYRGMTHAFLDKFGIFPQGQHFADAAAKWLHQN